MMSRAFAWSGDRMDSPPGEVIVELRHVDVGDVRGTVGLMLPDPDTFGANELVLGPFTFDELEDVAAMIADAADEARRWSTDSAR